MREAWCTWASSLVACYTQRMLSRQLSSLTHVGLLGAALALCAGCGEEERDVFVAITVGYETDAFQQDPAVERVVVQALQVNGDVFASAETTPGGSFDLGDIDDITPLRFEVSGYSSDGTLRVRGRSLTINVAQLLGDELPVFAQRVDQWARPPGTIEHAHTGGVAASLGERYLMHTGGQVVGDTVSPGGIAFYDLLAWGGALGGELDNIPESLVLSANGDAALFIDDNGARWIDFSNNAITPVEAPDGLGTFAAVAGGKTIVGDGLTYVVGGTRSDEASDKVLIVGDDFSLSAVSLTAPRQGASASWLEDVGLVVAAGSDTAAGIEVLSATATSFAPRAFPPDATTGAAAIADVLPGQLLLAGGLLAADDATIRRFDLGCASDCLPVANDNQLPLPLDDAQAFGWTGGDVVVLGHAASDNLLHTYLLSASGGVRELTLREPRRGARAVGAPNGTLSLIGGELVSGEPALTVESLFPR